MGLPGLPFALIVDPAANAENLKLGLKFVEEQERKRLLEERKVAAEERKAIAEERKAAAEERKAAVAEETVSLNCEATVKKGPFSMT